MTTIIRKQNKKQETNPKQIFDDNNPKYYVVITYDDKSEAIYPAIMDNEGKWVHHLEYYPGEGHKRPSGIKEGKKKAIRVIVFNEEIREGVRRDLNYDKCNLSVLHLDKFFECLYCEEHAAQLCSQHKAKADSTSSDVSPKKTVAIT